MPPAHVLAPLAAGWTTRRAAYPGFSWVPPERWHITLAFFGELTSGQRRRLGEGIAPLAAAAAPLAAALAETGVFPSAAKARVFWVGVEAPGLVSLATEVRAAARAAQIPCDDKPFRPHITMARSHRDAAPSDVPHLLRKLAVADGASWEISRLVLLESTGGQTPEYAELVAWPLTGLRTT